MGGKNAQITRLQVIGTSARRKPRERVDRGTSSVPQALRSTAPSSPCGPLGRCAGLEVRCCASSQLNPIGIHETVD